MALGSPARDQVLRPEKLACSQSLGLRVLFPCSTWGTCPTPPSFLQYLAFYGTMPRDLFSSESKDDSLVASPESQTPKPENAELASSTGNDGYSQQFTIQRGEDRESTQQSRSGKVNANEDNNLHPYVQTLSLSNLDSCVALENAIFPEHERCSREKVNRLSLSQLIASGNSALLLVDAHVFRLIF